MTQHDPALEGEVLEDHCLTLQQLSLSAIVEPGFVVELVEYQVLEPEGQRSADWRFSSADLVRLRRARRLMRDFELNLSGLALAMQLLDELLELRARQ